MGSGEGRRSVMQLYVGTEISGKHPTQAHIIETAAVVMNDQGLEIASFATLAHPEDPAWPGLEAAGVITAEEFRYALPERDAAIAFGAFLDRHRSASMHAYGSRLAQGLFALQPWNLSPGRWGENVRAAAAAVMEHRVSSGPRPPRLAEAAAFFDVPSGIARALDRARATAAIHRAIQESFSQAEDESYHFMEDTL